MTLLEFKTALRETHLNPQTPINSILTISGEWWKETPKHDARAPRPFVSFAHAQSLEASMHETSRPTSRHWGLPARDLNVNTNASWPSCLAFESQSVDA